LVYYLHDRETAHIRLVLHLLGGTDVPAIAVISYEAPFDLLLLLDAVEEHFVKGSTYEEVEVGVIYRNVLYDSA